MRSRIIRIGNSRGLRIPKALLEQAGLHEEVELSVEGGGLWVRPAVHPRAGWDEQFKAMAERGDDRLDWPDQGLSAWDDSEWTW